MSKKLTFKRLKSWYRLQDVSGNLGVDRLWVFLKTSALLVAIIIIFGLLYQVACTGAAELPFFQKIMNNSKDLLELFFGFITIGASSYACIQISLMKDINRTEMCHEIYKADQKYRNNSKKSKENMHKLIKKMENKGITKESEEKRRNNNEESKFQELFQDREYETLRAYAYHYEYIGYLTLRRKLNFDVAFDTITFPNWLINSEEAKKIIEIGRVYTPDFWNGSEYLYRSYEVRRAYSMKKLHSESAEADGGYKKVCRIWRDKYESLI